MKTTNLIITAIWLYTFGGGLIQGYFLPTSKLAQHFPFPWQLLVAMPLMVVIPAFFRKEIPGEFTLGKRVDEKLGDGTYREFLRKLKPELLFSLMCFGIGIVGLIRTELIGGPPGAYPLCIFALSGGTSFLITYFIALKRNSYGAVSAQSVQIESYTPTDVENFWREAGVRRNLFFAVWVGWLVASPCLIWFYSAIFPGLDFIVRAFAALATWGAVWIWTSLRIRQMKCFRCGQQAFSGPYFFMRHAKCRNCGVMPADQK